ncbi:MAG TPA: DUF4132 domain-containing protein [Streptosporangiaceae bacterium]|nr:DUF4132 domain-containing protein [Streptosporangiaceae bacterium]
MRRGADSGDEPDWPEHEARAGHLAGSVRPFGAKFEMYTSDQLAATREWIGAARSSPPEVIRSLLLLLIRRAAREGGWGHDTVTRVRGVSRPGSPVPAAEAAYALRTAAALPDTWWASSVLTCASAMAAQADVPDDPDLATAAAILAESLSAREYVPARDRNQIRRQLAGLAPRPRKTAPIDAAAITAGDGWSAVVLTGLAAWDGAAHPVNLLIGQLRSASGRKPTKTWLATAAELLAAPDARRFLRLLLEAVTCAQGVLMPDRYGWGQANLVVSWRNADLLRAAAWAGSVLDDDWVIPALDAVARRGMHGSGDPAGQVESAGVPHACIHSLGLIASGEAIASLLRLHRSTTDTGFRKQIGAALAVAAQRAGLAPGELAERIVPDAGLDRHGEQIVSAGVLAARVRITDDWQAAADWRGTRGWTHRPPAAADAAARQVVKTAVKQVQQALAGERSRLECLLAADRTWAIADWRAWYCEHPVTAAFARALLWVIETPAGVSLTGLPAGNGTLTTLDGQRDLPAAATVRLWHPARAGAEEVLAWREFLLAAGVRQPFRQAFREVYRIAPADGETATYSSRFAGHILRYQQAFALFSERGWRCDYLGPYDGGSAAAASREFPDARLTAVLDHHAVDGGPGDLRVEHCAAGRVFFHRTGSRARTPVRLRKVPELVFTETMRDVDRFVSVTSIANDPRWSDRRDDPHFEYWQRHSFGPLGTAASVRREVLARIVPTLKFAARLELDDRCLRVRGGLHSYKIHIGTGNVLIDSQDRYLRVVPPVSQIEVALPFGDDVLRGIVSTAQLLAADDKITDPAIADQLSAQSAQSAQTKEEGPRR